MLFGGGSEVVEHNSGLNPGHAAGRVYLENPRHVLRKVEDDRDVAALPGKRSTAAPAQQRCAELPAELDCGEDVVGIARQHDSNRNLAVVGTVGRVESAATEIEANFSAYPLTQNFRQTRSIHERRV
jgi:hypothetical protein